MISIIQGSKGTGKTKQIIGWANSAMESAKGVVAYVTDTNAYTREIDLKIRYVACDEYSVKSKEAFLAFVQGMLASNHDIEEIFVDGVARITKTPIEELEDLFDNLMALSEKAKVQCVFTVSCEGENSPEFIKALTK